MKQFIIVDCASISPYNMYFLAFSYNLLSMASYILENTEWEVKIIVPRMDFGCPLDEEGTKYIEDQVVRAVQQKTGEGDRIVFGFSITGNDGIVYALPLAEKLKKLFDAPILYGGFGPTISHRTICEDYSEVVDAVVVGAGEQICVDLLKNWDGRGPVPDIPGIAVMRNGEFVFTPRPAGKIRPLPDRLHMDVMDNIGCYKTVIYNTTYGCRFKCSFCIERYMNHGYWSKSLSHVRQELETLFQAMEDLSCIVFADPLIDFQEDRAAGLTDICKELGITYFCGSHVETTPLEAIPMIAKACRGICYGLEHGSPDILMHMKKTKDPDTYLKRLKELFRISTDNGMLVLMSVIMNYPGTRRIDIEKTVQLFDELFEDYYKRFRPGEGPSFFYNINRFRQASNDFLKGGEIQEFNKTSVTWQPWFDKPYRGFPVRKNLLRFVKDPSDDISGEEVSKIVIQIYEKAGMQDADYLKHVEERFPIFNHRLWLGGDLLHPCIDDENPHIFSMKKLADLR